MAEKLRDYDNAIHLEDPNRKNSSINYAHILRDVDNNAMTVALEKTVNIQETLYKMPLETCQELVEISVAFEDFLHNLKNGRDEQDQDVSDADHSEEG